MTSAKDAFAMQNAAERWNHRITYIYIYIYNNIPGKVREQTLG